MSDDKKNEKKPAENPAKNVSAPKMPTKAIRHSELKVNKNIGKKK